MNRVWRRCRESVGEKERGERESETLRSENNTESEAVRIVQEFVGALDGQARKDRKEGLRIPVETEMDEANWGQSDKKG